MLLIVVSGIADVEPTSTKQPNWNFLCGRCQSCLLNGQSLLTSTGSRTQVQDTIDHFWPYTKMFFNKGLHTTSKYLVSRRYH